MNDFANYDPRMWLDEIFSRHVPRRLKAKGGEKHERSAGLLTAATASIGVAIAAMTPQFLMPQSDVLRIHPDQSVSWNSSSALTASLASDVYWVGTKDPSRVDLVTSFEDRTSALIRQLKTGALVNVPSETLKLASTAVARAGTASDDWVARVANEVAKLTD